MNLIATVILSVFTLANTEVTTHISEIRNHQVSCRVFGNENSTHYDKPILIELKNSGNRSVKVQIPAGTIFQSLDSIIQDMIILEDVELWVGVGDKRSLALNAMCIQPSHRAPGSESQYVYSDKTNDKLNRTIAFITREKIDRATAQEAIWTVINQPNRIELSGWNADQINEVGVFLAELLHLPTPEPVTKDDPRLYSAPVRRAKVSANFSFYFPEMKDVRVALFDRNGILQRELYKRDGAAPGEYSVSLSFDGTPYIGERYQFKLIADGEVVLVRELDLR